MHVNPMAYAMVVGLVGTRRRADADGAEGDERCGQGKHGFLHRISLS
jgi:hypothetical protein